MVLPARSCYRARQHPTNASIPLTQQPFPGSVEEITADWLNRSLGIAVTGVQATRIGQDEGFSGCRLYRLALRGTGPGSLVAKLSPAEPAAARRMATANGREVAFYAAQGPDTLLPMPRCALALFDPDTGKSLLLLQDLGAHRALPFAAGLGVDEAGLALQALAGIHARWWADPGVDGPTLQQTYPFQTLWPAYLDHIARMMPDLAVPPAMRALGDRIAADPVQACARLDGPGPLTRVHGDAQVDNLRFAGGRAVFLDWQLTGRGAGMADVGYLMISSLAPSLRRQHERALVDLYQTALNTRAVRGNDTDGYVPAAAGKLWITVAATLQYDNASPAKQRWRRTDLERLAAFCTDHNPAAAFV